MLRKLARFHSDLLDTRALASGLTDGLLRGWGADTDVLDIARGRVGGICGPQIKVWLGNRMMEAGFL
jgi:hypothetical protein